MLKSNSPVVSFALHTTATLNGYKKILLRVYFKGFYKKRSTGLAVKVKDWVPVDRESVVRAPMLRVSMQSSRSCMTELSKTWNPVTAWSRSRRLI